MNLFQILMLLGAVIFFLGIYFIIPAVYVGVRILLGHHITDTMRETEAYKRGIDLVNQEQYAEGLKYFNVVLNNHPKSAVAWRYKAQCNYALDNLYEAIYDCDRATNYDYSLSACYMIKGKALFQLNNYREAHDEFARAVWFFQDKAEPYRYKGLSNYRLGNFEAAKTDFLRAIRFQDEDANHFLQKMEGEIDTI